MKLSSEKALLILENIHNQVDNAHFINHSICVGNTAGVMMKIMQRL